MSILFYENTSTFFFLIFGLCVSGLLRNKTCLSPFATPDSLQFVPVCKLKVKDQRHRTVHFKEIQTVKLFTEDNV